MIAIACAERNFGIGLKGKLLAKIPEDMKFFRETTTGKTVVMGRKTLESLPDGKPLPNRRNVVLSSNMQERDGIVVCRNLDDLFEVLAGTNPDDTFVVGGGKVYETLLPYCSKVLLTRIDSEMESDVRFPNVERRKGWRLASESEPREWKGTTYHFQTFENESPLEIPANAETRAERIANYEKVLSCMVLEFTEKANAFALPFDAGTLSEIEESTKVMAKLAYAIRIAKAIERP